MIQSITKKCLVAALALAFVSCSKGDLNQMIDNDLKVAGEQLSMMSEVLMDTKDTYRSWDETGYKVLKHTDWTCGFYPGSLWLYYELTGKPQYKNLAKEFTSRLSDIPYLTNTHDLGFMVFCSYGRQYASDKDSVSAAAIIQASKSLISRFDQNVGLIRSWDFGTWNYPVIIDNMMNLEMLFWTSDFTGDPIYREIAIRHADNTLANHFRPDYSCYHVVSYNNDGTVESKGTFQGYSDDSDWARGQAWALYGYTMCYRYTGFERYLNQAKNVASLIMKNPTTPKDGVPYWDYKSPDIPNTSKDASAAAITASAMLELTKITSDKSYLAYAETVMKTLSSDEYLAKPGTNGFFILKHSTGAASLGSEIDVPLVYADYYFLEAIKRYKELKESDK